MDLLTHHEASAVLCLLMIEANNENKPEEVQSMLKNPFFMQHIADKIGSPKKFLRKYNEGMGKLGEQGMERIAITTLKGAYPAFRLKTLALMTLIAGADEDYDQEEKELVARVTLALRVPMEDIAPELEKMKNSIVTSSPKASPEVPDEPVPTEKNQTD